MEERKTKKRSLILQYFPKELYVELMKVTMLPYATNNEKGIIIEELLNEYNVPASRIGSGTNRIGIILEGYVFKIALDKDGMIDNRREFRYTKDLYPRVIKVYECTQNGLISVSEYLRVFEREDYDTPSIQEEIREILAEVSSQFLIGDVGLTTKNFANWGYRDDGSIAMLDFAYIYSSSYRTFLCNCDGETLLRYDKDYVNLICPRCGRRYTFGQIRKKITRKVQEEEIGDIRKLGYNLREPIETVSYNASFEPNGIVKKKKKAKDDTKAAIKAYKKRKREEKEDDEYEFD